MGFLDVGGLRNNNRGMEIAKIILEIAVTFPQLFKHSNIPARRSTKESARAKEPSYPSPLLSYGTDIARKREDAKERTVLVRASSIHRIFPVDVSFSWNRTDNFLPPSGEMLSRGYVELTDTDTDTPRGEGWKNREKKTR